MKEARITKTFFVIFAVLAIGGAGYYFYWNPTDWFRQTSIKIEKEIGQLHTIEQKIFAPLPLIGPVEEVPSYLTVAGTVSETNLRRMQMGLSPLSVNIKLSASAEIKIDDMFARQYFEHESPTGEGPGELAEKVGYDYFIVGENLALGNYKDDKALVDAWMNSPGHRENILNAKYIEMGVAVKRGIFKGQTVWLAVQEFGRPASICPKPSVSIEAEIDANKILLSELEGEIVAKRNELDRMRPKRGSEYNKKVDEYNELVYQYNLLAEETEVLISEYNAQVNEFNACIQ